MLPTWEEGGRLGVASSGLGSILRTEPLRSLQQAGRGLDPKTGAMSPGPGSAVLRLGHPFEAVRQGVLSLGQEGRVSSGQQKRHVQSSRWSVGRRLQRNSW